MVLGAVYLFTQWSSKYFMFRYPVFLACGLPCLAISKASSCPSLNPFLTIFVFAMVISERTHFHWNFVSSRRWTRCLTFRENIFFFARWWHWNLMPWLLTQTAMLLNTEKHNIGIVLVTMLPHLFSYAQARFISCIQQLQAFIVSHHFINSYVCISLAQTYTTKFTWLIIFDWSLSSLSVLEVITSFMFASVFFLLATDSSGS